MEWLKIHPAKAEPISLRYRLHKSLAGHRNGRSLLNLHASDMTKDVPFCARQRLLQRLLKLDPAPEFLSAPLAMVFGFGRMIERHVQEVAADAGIAVGDWFCPFCGNQHSMQLRPRKCHKCCHGDLEYRERRFVSQVSGVSCGLDLLVTGLGPKFKIVEIKTMQKEDFKKLVAPLAEHRLRTNLYMRIVAESNDEDRAQIDTTEAVVLYVEKGGFGAKDEEVLKWKLGDGGFSPFREYVVKRDDVETTAILSHSAGPIAYRKAMEEKTVPSGCCVHQHTAQAKGCPVVAQCFSGNFPVGKAWG